MIMFNPELLSEKADPKGSVRYVDVNICHEKIECKHREVFWYDDLEKSNAFIIEDHSPDYEGYKVSIFKGTVVKEADGKYSWWRSL